VPDVSQTTAEEIAQAAGTDRRTACLFISSLVQHENGKNKMARNSISKRTAEALKKLLNHGILSAPELQLLQNEVDALERRAMENDHEDDDGPSR
jgi:hypothetical protein